MAESLQGKLLLASPEMGDPNFERTVILLVEHNDEGAMGLVINRPTDVAVADVLAEHSVDVSLNDPDSELLYRGGPCDGPLMVLHGGVGEAAADEVAFPLPTVGDGREVVDGVWFGSDRVIVEPALTGAIRPARFFAGYAGWGAGQLEAELASASWTVIQAEANLLWGGEGQAALGGDDLWTSLVRRQASADFFKGWNPKIVPRDPSMN